MRIRKSLAIVAATVVLVVSCAGGDPAPEPIVPDPAPESTRKNYCTESAVAAVLSVTDSGWSVNESFDKHKGVTFAGIIANPSSTEAALTGTVDVRFLNSDGADVPWAYQGENYKMSYELGTLHAGDETAVAGYAHLTEVPDRVEIVPQWACGRPEESASACAVTVESVTASLSGVQLSLDLALSSTVDEAVQGFPIVVFRDASGVITGGGPYYGVIGPMVSISGIQPGTSERQVSIEVDGHVPVEGRLDLGATSVYIGRWTEAGMLNKSLTCR